MGNGNQPRDGGDAPGDLLLGQAIEAPQKDPDGQRLAYPVVAPPLVQVYSPSRKRNVTAALEFVSLTRTHGFVRYAHSKTLCKWMPFNDKNGLLDTNPGLHIPAAPPPRPLGEDASATEIIPAIVVEATPAQQQVAQRTSHARWYIAAAAAGVLLLIGSTVVFVRGCDAGKKDGPLQPKQPPAGVVPGERR